MIFVSSIRQNLGMRFDGRSFNDAVNGVGSCSVSDDVVKRMVRRGVVSDEVVNWVVRRGVVSDEVINRCC